jgi:hypothetical protein
VSEVKNVSSLSYSSQLRDYVSYAQQTRRQVDLYVRGGSSRTRLSGPLHERDPRPERPDQPEVHSVSAKRSKRSKRGPIYATDLMAELEADPEYVAHQKRRDAELERMEEESRRAQAPVADELRAAGVEVDSAWDLVNTSTPYPAALPILLEHLERPYPDRVREGIARALAVGRDAKFAWRRLVALYRDEPVGTDAKDGLAVALAAVSDDDVVDELVGLARDAVHGESRILLLRGLKRSRAPQARAALEEFSGDPVLGEQAGLLLSGRAG